MYRSRTFKRYNKMNRERLSIYEECKIIVALERKVLSLKHDIQHAGSNALVNMWETEVKELTQIINKLK